MYLFIHHSNITAATYNLCDGLKMFFPLSKSNVIFFNILPKCQIILTYYNKCASSEEIDFVSQVSALQHIVTGMGTNIRPHIVSKTTVKVTQHIFE